MANLSNRNGGAGGTPALRRTAGSDSGSEVADRGVAARFDPLNLPAAFYEDPFPTYHALRSWDPVHRCPDGSYFLTRYDDLVAIYKDPRRFSSDKKSRVQAEVRRRAAIRAPHDQPGVQRPAAAHPGPAADRGRADAARDRRMEPDLVALVDGLLDAMAEARGGRPDRRFRRRHPDRGHRQPARRAARRTRARCAAGRWPSSARSKPAITHEQLTAATRRSAISSTTSRAWWRTAGATRAIRTRRADPADPGRGRRRALTESELLQNCIFILNAGHETTTNLIGNGLVAFADGPGTRAG